MKVYELMVLLQDLPSGADVQLVEDVDSDGAYGSLKTVGFEGEKAEDAFVNLYFNRNSD